MVDLLNALNELWHHHRHVLYLVAGWYLFNCAVQALPKPNGARFYPFFYGFIHLVAGNLGLLFKAVTKIIAPKGTPK